MQLLSLAYKFLFFSLDLNAFKGNKYVSMKSRHRDTSLGPLQAKTVSKKLILLGQVNMRQNPIQMC